MPKIENVVLSREGDEMPKPAATEHERGSTKAQQGVRGVVPDNKQYIKTRLRSGFYIFRRSKTQKILTCPNQYFIVLSTRFI